MFEIGESWRKLSKSKNIGMNVDFSHSTMQWRYMGRDTTQDACTCNNKLCCKMCNCQNDSKISNAITNASSNKHGIVTVLYINKHSARLSESTALHIQLESSMNVSMDSIIGDNACGSV